MLTSNNLRSQKAFLDKIKSILPPNISLVDELSETLQVSADSIYRRLRGETSLTFDEVVLLCNRYNISFDAHVDSRELSVSFNYNILPCNLEGFKTYLRSIRDEMKLIATLKGAKIIYVAEDIPIFHLFMYPELAAFKMYYWMRSVQNIPEYQNQKYTFELTDMEILEIGRELRDAYTTVDSVEIWTEYTPNSLRMQVEYYWDAGLFADCGHARLICDQAIELVNTISSLAQKRSKMPDGETKNYTLYYSEIEIGNNCVLVDINGYKKVFLTYNTYSKMSTTNEKFCGETENWINFLIAKSNLISGVSEKQRLRFVNKIVAQIDNTRKLLNA